MSASADRIQLLAVEPGKDDHLCFSCSIEEFADIVWAVLRQPELDEDKAGMIVRPFLKTTVRELMKEGLSAAVATRLSVPIEEAE